MPSTQNIKTNNAISTNFCLQTSPLAYVAEQSVTKRQPYKFLRLKLHDH